MELSWYSVKRIAENLKEHIRVHKPSIVILMETKVSSAYAKWLLERSYFTDFF